jgi:hypothetical protein
LEVEGEIVMDSGRRRSSVTTADGRELVSFITTQGADDLIVAYAIALDQDLDERMALPAGEIGVGHGLPRADSEIVATARHEPFKPIPEHW